MIESAITHFKTSGLFVGFEGIDGSGKTTLINLVLQKLSALGHSTLKTREPGGTPAGQAIRTLLQHSTVDLSPLSEAFLFAADRTEHIATVVKPALKQGKIVLSDRTYVSSIVYQTEKTLSGETIQEINRIALQGCYPDLIVYVDLDPEEARKRFMLRSETQTRFEARGLAFFKNVHARYANIIELLPNVLHIDGIEDAETNAQAVAEKIIADLATRRL
jgi:dTMP kinase